VSNTRFKILYLVTLYAIFVKLDLYLIMSLYLYMQTVDGIENTTATQLDVADIGSLSDLVSQVSFILILKSGWAPLFFKLTSFTLRQ
jgi:hypothetical protein